jgi:hypothetical protein
MITKKIGKSDYIQDDRFNVLKKNADLFRSMSVQPFANLFFMAWSIIITAGNQHAFFNP